jgi:3-hydroxy-9,10-secoandrosta-1,3,5(10)-triene-9,17-dione monooxygenase
MTTIADTSPGSALGGDYLANVADVLPAIRARSAQTEALGRMPDATIDDLDRCGLFIALQPLRFGGLEIDPVTFYESVVQLGTACGAAGWVGGVLAAHPWELGCMSPDAQLDVWADDERARISSSYAPTGTARRVADGYLVQGRWGFSSGIDHCAWSLLGAIVDGEDELGIRVFLVPRRDVRIDHDSWRVAGLAGTGSKDVHLAGAVVPEHRTHLIGELSDGRWARPGWAINSNPLYRLPWMNMFSWAIAAPALGAATGLIDTYRQQTKTRVGAYGGPPVAKNIAIQLRLAEAIASVDALRRSMTTGWQELHDAAQRDGRVDKVAAARSRYAAARTITESLTAALTVFSQAGGGVMHLDNPLQRYLRDLLAMRNHPMAALDRFAAEQMAAELVP